MVDSSQNIPIPLADIITPETVNFWPLAIGWWLLLALIIISTTGIIIAYRRHQKKWGYRKQALSLLKQKMHVWENKNSNTEKTCHELLVLLKRTAITAYPNKDIAVLYGGPWLTVLNRQTAAPLFDQTLSHLICTEQYQPKNHTDINHLGKACEQWIKQHKEKWQGEST